MSRTDRDLALAQAACRLRAAAPSAWDEFTQAFQAYSTEVRDSFLTTPQADLAIIQGQARACAALLNVLRDAPRLVDEARTRNQQRNANRT